MRLLEVLARLDWWVVLVAGAIALVGCAFIHSTTLDERAWWDMVDFEDHDGELDRLLSCSWFFEVPIHRGEAP